MAHKDVRQIVVETTEDGVSVDYDAYLRGVEAATGAAPTRSTVVKMGYMLVAAVVRAVEEYLDGLDEEFPTQ